MNRFHQIPRRLIVAVALVAAGAHFTIAAERDDFPDVRRVLLRPEQLPAELERVRRGVLRQMPLTDFDALIAARPMPAPRSAIRPDCSRRIIGPAFPAKR